MPTGARTPGPRSIRARQNDVDPTTPHLHRAKSGTTGPASRTTLAGSPKPRVTQGRDDASYQGLLTGLLLSFSVRQNLLSPAMTDIRDNTTIAAAFSAAVAQHADRPFFIVPAHAERAYLPAGYELS